MQRHALTPFTNGLVNLETGQISREIFVNEAISINRNKSRCLWDQGLPGTRPPELGST
jgi:hypothetical protein